MRIDLKVMPRSYEGHRFILEVINEATHFMVTIPIHSLPKYMTMDQDSAFMSTLINYLFKKLGIKIETVAPHNHQSLQAECGIKSLTTILMKHLTELQQY